MLHKTRGIVINTIDYSDTSIIAKIYTELFGLQSYLINSVRTAKAKNKPNLFQPLTLLELVVYHKPNNGLQRTSSIVPDPRLNTIPYDIVKSSIAIFINELVYKTIREETPNQDLFSFLYNSVLVLDHIDLGVANFHLVFMLQYTKIMGFSPTFSDEYHDEYFDIKEGVFTEREPVHSKYAGKYIAGLLKKLNNISFSDLQSFNITHAERKELLQLFENYYSTHIPGFVQLKSIKVLEQILS